MQSCLKKARTMRLTSTIYASKCSGIFLERINGADTESKHDVDSTGEDDIGDASETIPKRCRLSYDDSAKVLEESKAQRKVDRLSVVTGNKMIDQFQPWYFGVALAFLFKFCTGMPDMPAFAKKPRYRRQEDAPRIEVDLWVRVMSRRIEACLSRDWIFGFTTWIYLFRSAVNTSRTFFACHAKTDDVEGNNTFTP